MPINTAFAEVLIFTSLVESGFPFKTEEWELRNKEKRKVFDTFTQNIIDVANTLQRHIRAVQPQ